MYAITLWQPWASLIAVDAKRFETRSWKPPAMVLGQKIAIHAAARPLRKTEEWEDGGPIDEILRRRFPRPWWRHQPLGEIVCTARLTGVYRMVRSAGPAAPLTFEPVFGLAELAPPEPDLFGYYAHGRYAWRLDEVANTFRGIKAKGAQGFWNWEL